MALEGGQLGFEDFRERLDAAGAAIWTRELDRLVRDLPEPREDIRTAASVKISSQAYRGHAQRIQAVLRDNETPATRAYWNEITHR
jgi:hypothetical protein